MSPFPLVVPLGAKPGVTVLEVNTCESGPLRMHVPDEAQPGDELRLSFENGGWNCTIMKCDHDEVMKKQGRLEASLSKNQETKELSRAVFVVIPEDAEPGRTRLHVDVGQSQDLLVLVPTDSRPGDRLVLSESIDGKWDCHVDKTPSQAEETFQLQFKLSYFEVDSDVSYNRLVTAALRAGGCVNPKLERGVAPPLNIPGLIAHKKIDAGEELCRMPAGLLVSPTMCQVVMPELFNAVQAIQAIPTAHRDNAAMAACLSVLFQNAEDRIGCMHESVAQSGPHAAVLDLWACYADTLLGESFHEHPYVRAISDPDSLRASLAPSTEYDQICAMSNAVLAIYRSINVNVPADLLGPRFEAGLYMKAWLSILSRVFSTSKGESVLVPVTDLCNHLAEPGTEWFWDDSGNGAHVLKATRMHAPGEEIRLSYGLHSNTLLYRTYGFTLPPSMEPSWSYLLAHPPQDFYNRFILPEQDCHIHLDTLKVQESLISALNACVDYGSNPEDFLRELCERALAEYKRDPKLAPALLALQRARAIDPTSAAWWDKCDKVPPLHGEPADDRAEEAALRVKMSEYLCLTAHLEAVDVATGRLSKEQCLACGARVLETLCDGFEALRSGKHLRVVSTPVTIAPTVANTAGDVPNGLQALRPKAESFAVSRTCCMGPLCLVFKRVLSAQSLGGSPAKTDPVYTKLL